MELVARKLKDIHPYDNNPRINDKAADAVVKSNEAYGFKVPMVISKDGEIVCGHTRYKAAQKLGLKEVPCIIADDLTDDQIKAFRLADNKVSDASIWDNKKLLEELEGISDGLFTGFEFGDIFDHTLDESDRSAIDGNVFGVMYEATFRSEDPDKIQKLQEIWDGMNDEE